jgi:hypothetical protein
MKGELGYLGIAEVTQKARELEELGRTHDLEQAARVFASLEPEISMPSLQRCASENRQKFWRRPQGLDNEYWSADDAPFSGTSGG